MKPEPAQPAESPEAIVKAVVNQLVEEGRAKHRCLNDEQQAAADEEARAFYRKVIDRYRAATTARPTERGAVEEEAEAAYRAAWLQSSVDPMFRGTVDEGWRDWWHYRAWVASQSALTPPVTVAATDQADRGIRINGALATAADVVALGRELDAEDGGYPQPATDQAGEVEATGALLICDQTGGRMWTRWPVDESTKQEADSLYGDTGGYRTVPLYAALDTQPATGRTMGGEDGLREAIRLALQCTPYVAMGAEQYEVGYDCGDPWEILRAALQNGGE